MILIEDLFVVFNLKKKKKRRGEDGLIHEVEDFYKQLFKYSDLTILSISSLELVNCPIDRVTIIFFEKQKLDNSLMELTFNFTVVFISCYMIRKEGSKNGK